MKKKLIIFTIFVSLIITYFIQESEKPEKSTSAGYYPLVSKEFTPSQVNTITFYPPQNKEAALIIKRSDSKEDEWIVTSRFNAPAESASVKKLLSQIEGMEGEERADDPSLLGSFELGDEESYHMVLSGEKDELYHFLIGKRAETFTFGFLRFKGENRVFIVDKDFRYEFGVTREGATSHPDQLKWVNKRIVSIKRGDLQKVTFEDKNGSITFEKDMTLKEGAADKPGAPHGASGDESWALVSPGEPRREVPWESIRGLIASLASLGGSDIVDPSLKRDFGLEEPHASITITQKGGERQKIYLGSVKGETEEKFYVYKEGLNLIFEIYSSVKEGVFDRFEEIKSKM